jgi:hypothetical protein
MKTLMIAALALGLCAVSASAQTAAPPPDATNAAPPASAPATAKQVRAQCRADAQAQGLAGAARKAAVDDCFAKARPDLAAAQKCRQEGKAKGLADQELKAFVKQCKTTAQ